MELQVLNHVQEFNWNFQEIRKQLASHIEKYHGLVVTEDNLKDMEAAQKEIAAFRINIDGFRKEVKKKMEEPYKQFEGEIKELQALVEQAEAPLKKQILQYELERVKAREVELLEFGRKTAKSLGLRDDYFKLAIPSKWTNRTAKTTAVKKEIITEIENLLDNQRQADEAAELKRQREELIIQLCESSSKGFGLKTAIVPADIAHLVKDVSLMDIPTIIQEACSARLELEVEAAKPPEPVEQPIVTPVEALPLMPPELMPTDYAKVPAPDQLPEPPPAQRVPMPPPVPPSSAIAPTLYFDCVIRYPKITIRQAAAIKQFIAAQGIQYEVVSQIQRSDA